MVTQYEIDMAPVATLEPDLTVIILRNDLDMVYATWTGTAWSLLRLNIGNGTCRTGGDYPSFIEAARAYRTGAALWEK